MSSEGSVSRWLDQMRQGNADATQALWERYFKSLIAHARQQLQGSSCGITDEEDAALSAFHSLYQALREGRYPELSDRVSFLRLLRSITENKVADQRRYDGAEKRGEGKVKRESEFANEDWSSDGGFLDQAAKTLTTPDVLAGMSETYCKQLERLADPVLQEIVHAKVQGYTNVEIAAQLNCSERTIERRLELIRKKWDQDDGYECTTRQS
jgi:RNA polymerase sigma factor (sigma-70 family)